MPLPRSFDHEEAARRLAAGETRYALAREYGVTWQAVDVAVKRLDETYRLEYNERMRDWRTVTCEGCGGPAMRITGTKAKPGHDGRILCHPCRGKQMRERLRYEGTLIVAVRCNMLDCATGERWQPLRNFTKGGECKDIRPGGIHSICRACQTRMKRAYRAAQRVPCESCGTLTSPASSPDRRRHDRALCRSCLLLVAA